MNLIWFSERVGRARQFNLTHPATLVVLAALVLSILGTAFVLGVKLGERTGTAINRSHTTAAFSGALDDEKREVSELRARLHDRVDAMALRLGALNAHILRLNALGKRLADMAKIDNREFNFDSEPATGGPESDGEGVSAQIPDLTAMLDSTERRIELRDAQLYALENVIVARKLSEEIHPEGRPVRQGFISSYFGQRQDPFTGEEGFHKGVDFAGNGDEVVAVAAGVVTWAGVQPATGSWWRSTTATVTSPAMPITSAPWSASARPSRAASPSPSWAQPAAPPAPTCISKCCATASRSTR